jgi:hypothetical protein
VAPGRPWTSTLLWSAVAVGAVVGVAYTLSPLTVWFTVAMLLLLRYAVRDLDGDERKWVLAILLLAVVSRVVVVAALFAFTDGDQVPFGSFFGDEEYFIRRSMWLRNVALGIPVHRADLIYAFDEYSYTHYLYVMALIQALVGFAPYGLHLVGIALYIGGMVLLFKVVRPVFGKLVAGGGLLLLAFLPTLFAWSVSALKEPPYVLISAVAFAATIAVVRARSGSGRVAAVLALVACAAALQAIRDGGLVIALISVVGGLALAWTLARPLRVALVALLLPSALAVVLTSPAMQIRAVAIVERAAAVHWGHINTAGFAFKSLDPRVYEQRANVSRMSPGEIGRYLARSTWHYFTAPLPWQIQSRATLLAVPELMAWYAMVLLAPIGFAAGLRRDRLVACVLASFVVGGAVLVAVTSGNIGTLIRHRSLVMPFLVWLSVLGGAACLAALVRMREGRERAAPAPPVLVSEELKA